MNQYATTHPMQMSCYANGQDEYGLKKMFETKQQTDQTDEIHKCAYCEETNGLVRCSCGKYICNGPVTNCSKCQILIHTSNCNHYAYYIGNIKIECYKCKESNIFVIRYRREELKFYCKECIPPNKEYLYKECVAKQGVFSLNNYSNFGTSIRSISLDKINSIDQVERFSISNIVHVKQVYNGQTDYINTYQTLYNYEEGVQYWEEYTYKKMVTFRKEKGKTYVTIKHDKKEKYPRVGCQVYLVEKGNKAILNKETEQYITNCADKLFKDCSFVVKGTVHCSDQKKTELVMTETVISDKLPIEKQTIPQRLFNTLTDSTQLFRLYVWTNQSNGNVITRSFDFLSKYEHSDDYYNTLFGSTPLTQQFYYNNSYINPPHLNCPVHLNLSQIAAVLKTPSQRFKRGHKHKRSQVDYNSFEDEDKKFYVTASSNNAVNVLTERLVDYKVNVFRIAANDKYEDLSDKVREVSLIYKAYEYAKNVRLVDIEKILKKKIDSFFTEKERIKINDMELNYNKDLTLKMHFKTFEKYFKVTEKDLFQRKQLSLNKTETSQMNDFMKNNLKNITMNCDVIAATLTKSLSGVKFWCALIDEAAQSIEPETFSAFAKVNKIVMIGDIQQLPPTILSDEAKEGGLEKSMFERLLLNKVPYVLLNTQYLMHPAISKFSNEFFYRGKLNDGVTANERSDNRINKIFSKKEFPVMFVHCKGDEGYGSSGKSYGNDAEKEVVKFLVEKYNKEGINDEEIGIISPYSTQRDLLGEQHKTIQVASVDGFQGNEKEFIIISCVRSNSKGGIGFLADHRRLNVALTRARKGLVMVGDAYTLRHNCIFVNFMKMVYDEKNFMSLKSHYSKKQKVNTLKLQNYVIEEIKNAQKTQVPNMVCYESIENINTIHQKTKPVKNENLNETESVTEFVTTNSDYYNQLYYDDCICNTTELTPLYQNGVRQVQGTNKPLSSEQQIYFEDDYDYRITEEKRLHLIEYEERQQKQQKEEEEKRLRLIEYEERQQQNLYGQQELVNQRIYKLANQQETFRIQNQYQRNEFKTSNYSQPETKGVFMSRLKTFKFLSKNKNIKTRLYTILKFSWY
ncbi:hypothetical protein EIN_520800 [Entamoeba invadens IP1]|uniref:Upf1 domain-containing protein n=1 Tax=Entamoeba invadens IP1 TaxID=370355 RepID=A0A0A1UFK9_ENTIV|nr:hypothetical protein EIN_520800 [Entamoeba invadens IP1]ELP91723.1 hypothetical protein EIN_520800 [Entamoeba invadens IP1]|eukprot:XP_004258494.1 hypothetical protein EIN_520800 [Entamoeba invadens IP1]